MSPEYQRARRAKFAAEGRCRTCGGAVVPGRKSCEHHLHLAKMASGRYLERKGQRRG